MCTSGNTGTPSSKRVMGIFTLLFSLGLTLYIAVKGSDYMILSFPYGVSTSLLGLGIFDKKKNV